MKNYYFRVNFITGLHHVIFTGNIAQARILAQAEEIQAGNDWHVKSVDKISDKEGARLI